MFPVNADPYSFIASAPRSTLIPYFFIACAPWSTRPLLLYGHCSQVNTDPYSFITCAPRSTLTPTPLLPVLPGQHWPLLLYCLVLLPSDALLALLLMGNLSCLYIFYHNCKGWSKHSSWSCWIPLVAWPRRDTSGELNHLWILSWCHMDYISFGSFRLVLWHRRRPEDIMVETLWK